MTQPTQLLAAEPTSSGVLSQIIDGAEIMIGMKQKGFDTLWERLGAVATVAVPTIFLNDRFRIKPALKALPENQRNVVVSHVFGGSITIGK